MLQTSDSEDHNCSIVTGYIELLRVLPHSFVRGKRDGEGDDPVVSRQIELSWRYSEWTQDKFGSCLCENRSNRYSIWDKTNSVLLLVGCVVWFVDREGPLPTSVDTL